jgi:hypothetical protein
MQWRGTISRFNRAVCGSFTLEGQPQNANSIADAQRPVEQEFMVLYLTGLAHAE